MLIIIIALGYSCGKGEFRYASSNFNVAGCMNWLIWNIMSAFCILAGLPVYSIFSKEQ